MGTTPANNMSRAVVWFRNDLRIRDNPTLQAAVRAVKDGRVHEILPCYCVDPRHFELTRWGNPKTHLFRARFLMESVLDLKQQLRSIGSDLLVTVGRPEDVIPQLAASLVLAADEPAHEEKQVELAVSRAVKRTGATVETLWGHTLHHMEDIPYTMPDLQDLPDGFTPFRNKVEKQCEPRSCLPAPAAGSLPLPANLPEGLDFQLSLEQLPLGEGVAAKFQAAAELENNRRDDTMPVWRGGESQALARLKYYLWDSDLIRTYFDSRNGMLGGDYSTKLSPWLAAGCISPREIYSECKRYEAERVSNKSTYWVVFELLWRDFFRFFCIKHGNRVFFEGGAKSVHIPWRTDAALLERWQTGNTGIPMVDANMRELAATGFQSNRGRQNVASYLCLDLQLDWRHGADYFESLLLDHDVSSNYGNWNAAAGLTGGRINKFNLTKQSRDYDPQGEYIRTWIPELSEVPLKHLFEPWKMPKSAQQAAGCVIGEHYPAPPAAQPSADRGGKGKGKGSQRRDKRGGSRLQHGGGQGPRTDNRESKGKRHNKGNSSARASEFEMYG